MSRSVVSLRCARASDAPALVEVWKDVLRRADPAQQLSDIVQVIADAADDPDQRLVIAECDGEVAGAVHLRATTLTAVNLEPTVQVISPHVLTRHRRRGIGRVLIESAVTFAEERGIGHVATAAASSSRDANRFMARLAFGPQAVLRVAVTHAVRAQLTARRPAVERSGRQLSAVLAARRSLRRQQSSVSS